MARWRKKRGGGGINIALTRGARGLPGNSSLAKLNTEVSEEHHLDYVNHLQKEPLNLETIKASILAHRREKGGWPTETSGEVRYGPLAGKETWRGIHAALTRGVRGLPGSSSLAMLNTEVSAEHHLDYVNRLKQELLNPETIKASILAHRRETGGWPTQTSGEVRYGPLAGKETWRGIHAALTRGNRSLPGRSSLAKLNAEVSAEHHLDYVNRLTQELLNPETIKASILAHRGETGGWPTQTSGEVRYGPLAGKETWRGIHAALTVGVRSLPGRSSLAKLNAEVSEEYHLDYVNHLKQEPLNPETIKASILAHRRETGGWPTQTSGEVRYGPLAEKERWGGINMALTRGARGLPGNSSLAKLNTEVSEEHHLDYVNHLKQEPLNPETIKASILAHRRETGRWPTERSGEVRYGPLAEKETWRAIEAALTQGIRGLPGNSSLAKLNTEVSAEHHLDYIKGKHTARLAASANIRKTGASV